MCKLSGVTVIVYMELCFIVVSHETLDWGTWNKAKFLEWHMIVPGIGIFNWWSLNLIFSRKKEARLSIDI